MNRASVFRVEKFMFARIQYTLPIITDAIKHYLRPNLIQALGVK